VLVLGFLFSRGNILAQHYRTHLWKRIFGILVCLAGLGLLLWEDIRQGRLPSDGDGNPFTPSTLSTPFTTTTSTTTSTTSSTTDRNDRAWLGDLLTLLGASLYAISNLVQEWYVKTRDCNEVLMMVGLFGVVVSGVQCLILESESIRMAQWTREGGTLCNVMYFVHFA
jgi:drug/metabolite transporter (DMT)-like permease